MTTSGNTEDGLKFNSVGFRIRCRFPKQRRERVVPETPPDPFRAARWKLIVPNNLRDDEKRFNDFKRSTAARSYTLSRVLDTLEAEGLVENRKEFESPVARYYTPTEKGAALCPVFETLDEWGEEWV